MGLPFTKMHGLGNDYVFVGCMDDEVADPAGLARRLADRHFGVGGDGLICIAPPRDRRHVCRMEMYNADGSRAQMCGNGVRCVGRWVRERGIATSDDFVVETDAGPRRLLLRREGGELRAVTVDMGTPRILRRDLPLADGGAPDETVVDRPLEIDGRVFRFTMVSLGNPHAVVRVDTGTPPGLPPLDALPLEGLGPRFERHPAFPERVNTEFVTARSPGELDLRVWERGSGETLACGTGACAAVVAGVLGGYCERRATVRLRGGDLEVEWTGSPAEGTVLLTGPAVEVFQGELSTSFENAVSL